MATTEQMNEEGMAFADAFGADDAPQQEMSEDEAFGIMPEEPAVEEPESEAAATDAAESGTEATPDAVVVIAEPVEGPVEEEEPTDPKELQRQKSWEGRLKAKEAELKAREEALKAAPAEAGEDMGEAETPTAEAVENVAAQVESGEMTVDQAVTTLGNDFGPEFTKMIGLMIEAKARDIASKMADEKVGSVRGELNGLVSEIVEDKKRSHMEMISDAHPDFIEVAGSPEFKAYVDSLPGSEQEQALKVIEAGSARQINKLLSAFKSTKAPEDTQAMDDAEGVRSSGLKIPEKPKKAESYEAAWDEYPD